MSNFKVVALTSFAVVVFVTPLVVLGYLLLTAPVKELWVMGIVVWIVAGVLIWRASDVEEGNADEQRID